jgi:hypothetical protein
MCARARAKRPPVIETAARFIVQIVRVGCFLFSFSFLLPGLRGNVIYGGGEGGAEGTVKSIQLREDLLYSTVDQVIPSRSTLSMFFPEVAHGIMPR